MTDLPLDEISRVPALRDCWVALDVRGIPRDDRPFQVALPSGTVVIDFDRDLGALCARVSDQNSLEIIFSKAAAG